MTVGGADARFVGRAAELEVFERAVEKARLGQPSVVLVGGEAGMGKTTLVTEAADRLGARLLVGRCLRLGGDVVPLGALDDLLRHLERTLPSALEGIEGIGRFAPWLEGAGTSDVAARAGAEGVFAPILELLGNLAADGALIVAFEDLHWADPTTWDLFELLARNLFEEHLVLAGTYRADEVARDAAMRRRIAELGRVSSVRRIELAGLDRDDVALRVAAIGGGVADAALVESIFERGGGNPFFTEELARAHLTGADVPEVLSDLISYDLAALAPPGRAVLDAAAAIGREVSHDLLAAVVSMDEPSLEAAVRDVVDAQLLVVDHGGDGYRFRHALIAEVAYDALLPPQRRRLHRRIADVLSTGAVAPPGADRSAQLALHLDRAGDVPGAFVALLEAADAIQPVAPAVALRQLERALELWESAGDAAAAESRCERLWQAAELATGSVGNARAVELAREAFRWGTPARGAAWAHERLGRYLWASGEIEASRPEFAAAASLVGSDGTAEGTLTALAGLAQAALMDADVDAAERWCAQVFERAPSPEPDPAPWVIATRVLAAAKADRADLVGAVPLGRAAMAAAPNAYARAMAAAYDGIVLIQAGEFQDAAEMAADGVRDARFAGIERSFGGYLDSVLVEALVRLGRWEEADRVVARRLAAVFDGFHPGRARMLVTSALVAARRGQAERAASLLEDTRSGPIDPFHSPLIHAGTAEAHLALGQWSQAAEAADQGWAEVADRRPWWAVRLAWLSACATVEVTLDAVASKAEVDVGSVRARLRDRIEHARSLVADRGGAIVEAQLCHAEAMLTLLGDADPAAWADVAARWGALPERWMAGDASLREAEAWYAIGDAARSATALRAAHVIALDLSSATLLERVESVSRRTRISVESAELVVVDERSADRLGLTPREAEVLGLVAAGRTNRQIGADLYVSEKTASVHVSNILRKLGVSTRVEAAAIAQRLGIG